MFNESENLMYLKIFMHKKKISLFSVEFCLSADKIRSETLLCFKRTLVSKFFMHGRGASRFRRKVSVSLDRNRNLCKRNLLCSRKILVSKIFTQKVVGVRVRIRVWASRFCLKFFVSQCRKTLYGNILVWKKILWVRRDGCGQRFRRKFCLAGPNRITS